MGIFDFLISKSSPKGSSDSHLDGYAHQRYHARYILNNRDLCLVDHPKYGLFRVVDLSHHGCLVEPMSDASFDSASFPLALNLRLCGTSVKLEASQCQRRRQGWALVFRHVTEHSIREIGSFIEPLRVGSTASALESDSDRDGIYTKYRRRFLGDGPFEVVFEKNEAGDPVFVMVTIRMGSGDGCVIWNKGSVVTKRSNDTEGAFMPKTKQIDEELVWQCAATCLGMKFAEGSSSSRVLNDWLIAQAGVPQLAKSS